MSAGNEASEGITSLLLEWTAGDEAAFSALLPMVYEELRRMAEGHLRRERSGHTLQRTALVHEAFLRLVDQKQVDVRCRAQFFALASQVMRNILVDHARRVRADKRGGGAQRLNIEDLGEAGVQLQESIGSGAVDAPASLPIDVHDIDEALKRLEKLDPRLGKVVELRFFGSLSIEDTASALDISPATVKRDWMSARAWLEREIGSTEPR